MVPSITIELYGMARHRAGRAEVRLDAGTVVDALKGAGLEPSPQFLVSVNAGPFLADLNAALKPGDHVLVMSADAGG